MKALRVAVALLATTVAGAAHAQRTNDNAVRSAEDAFGRSIGTEQIGLYSEGEIRGFSPVAAGNVRIDGLYFDQQGGMSRRLVEGSTIRIGISAQGDPFPAPTGIVDQRMRAYRDEPLLSGVLIAGPLRTAAFELDGQYPIVPGRLGVLVGVTARADSSVQPGDVATTGGIGVSAVWMPRPGIRIRTFWGRSLFTNDNATPLILVAPPAPGEAAVLPPRVPRRFFGQDWTDTRGHADNLGLLASADLGGGWKTQLGTFRSRFLANTSFSDFYLDTRSDGTARHVIVGNPEQLSQSSSGELRLTKTIPDGPRLHTLIASLRERQVDRRYGGSASVALPPAVIGVREPVAEPIFAFGRRSRDRISQSTIALGYQLRWREVGELSLGIQRPDYHKIKRAAGAPDLVTDDNPWLFSATGALHLTSRLAVYGGYVKGLEESGSAPPEADNRNEAPPALLTSQYDGGIRYGVTPKLSLIAGIFDVRKPYFNLDQERTFRRLGLLRHRGVEVSLAGEAAPGLTMVVGAVLLDADISGTAAAGTIGRKPVGSRKLRGQANFDYRLPGLPQLSLDVSLSLLGKQIASADNRLKIPGRANIDMGLRYRVTLGGFPASLRVQVRNLLDNFGWTVSGGGAFTSNGPRRAGAQLAVDF